MICESKHWAMVSAMFSSETKLVNAKYDIPHESNRPSPDMLMPKRQPRRPRSSYTTTRTGPSGIKLGTKLS
jgi:hypothetical protein